VLIKAFEPPVTALQLVGGVDEAAAAASTAGGQLQGGQGGRASPLRLVAWQSDGAATVFLWYLIESSLRVHACSNFLLLILQCIRNPRQHLWGYCGSAGLSLGAGARLLTARVTAHLPAAAAATGGGGHGGDGGGGSSDGGGGGGGGGRMVAWVEERPPSAAATLAGNLIDGYYRTEPEEQEGALLLLSSTWRFSASAPVLGEEVLQRLSEECCELLKKFPAVDPYVNPSIGAAAAP